MRQRIAILATCLGLGLITLVPHAHGQRPPAESVTLQELRKDLDELREKVVQVPTLAAAVEELSTRLAVLEREVAERAKQQEAIPGAVQRIDSVSERARRLAMAVRALEARLADIEQPWAPAGGQGGAVSHEDGFRWQTADGRYALGLDGYLQVRQETQVIDGSVDTLGFRIRRARLGASGHVGSERMKYRLMLSPIEAPGLLDYYVDYAIRDQLVVRAGQSKTMFTRAFITPESQVDHLELSRAIDGVRYDRDIQVGVYGLLAGERVGYYASVGNGAGRNVTNDNIDVASTIRVDAVVFGKRFPYSYGDVARTDVPTLMVGAGAIHDLVRMPDRVVGVDSPINTDVDGDGDHDNVRVISASCDVIFRYRGWEAAVEGVLRRETFGTILMHPANMVLAQALFDPSDSLFMGVTGQLSTMLPRDVQVGARASYSRQPFLGVGGQESVVPRANHLLELDGLAELRDRSGNRILGLLYSYHHYDTDGVGDDHRVIVEAQVRL